MHLAPHKLDAVFGLRWSDPALFYAREIALRFELARRQHRIDRMLSAQERAQKIASRAFDSADDLTLAIVFFADSEAPGVARLLSVFRGLLDCGLPRPSRESIRVKRSDQEDNDDSFVFEMTTPINDDQIPMVFWAAFSQDLCIRPTVAARLYIASASRGLMMHPYDDRGMDVIGTSVDAIRPLYDEFHDWLLDSDLDSMTRVFGV